MDTLIKHREQTIAYSKKERNMFLKNSFDLRILLKNTNWKKLQK